MTTAPSYTVQGATIPAKAYLDISRSANAVTCLEATDWFQISFDAGPQSRFEQGLTFEPPETFSRIRLYNPHDAALAVRLGIGRGGIRDNRFIVEGALSTAARSPDILTTPGVVTVPAATTMQIAQGDQSRVELGVRNLSTTARIWVRADNGGGDGWPLDPKEGLILTSTAAVWVANTTTGGVQVAQFSTGRG